MQGRQHRRRQGRPPPDFRNQRHHDGRGEDFEEEITAEHLLTATIAIAGVQPFQSIGDGDK